MARKIRAGRDRVGGAASQKDVEGAWNRPDVTQYVPKIGREVVRPVASLGRVLAALGELVLATGGTVSAVDEDLAREHGKRVDPPDLERDPSNPKAFVRLPGDTGKRPDCSNTVTVEWRDYYITNDISAGALAAAVQAQIDQATAAAKALCTDSNCPDALVTVTYSVAETKVNTAGQAAKGNHLYQDDYIVRIIIQLEVSCRLLL